MEGERHLKEPVEGLRVEHREVLMVMVPRTDEGLDGNHRQKVGHDQPDVFDGEEEREVDHGEGKEDCHGYAICFVFEYLQQSDVLE